MHSKEPTENDSEADIHPCSRPHTRTESFTDIGLFFRHLGHLDTLTLGRSDTSDTRTVGAGGPEEPCRVQGLPQIRAVGSSTLCIDENAALSLPQPSGWTLSM